MPLASSSFTFLRVAAALLTPAARKTFLSASLSLPHTVGEISVMAGE